MGILISVLIGAVAGWLASKLMKSTSNGVFFNIILGILGGYVGKWLFDFFSISTGSWLGTIITATVGAVVLIAAVRFLTKKMKKK